MGSAQRTKTKVNMRQLLIVLTVLGILCVGSMVLSAVELNASRTSHQTAAWERAWLKSADPDGALGLTKQNVSAADPATAQAFQAWIMSFNAAVQANDNNALTAQVGKWNPKYAGLYQPNSQTSDKPGLTAAITSWTGTYSGTVGPVSQASISRLVTALSGSGVIDLSDPQTIKKGEQAVAEEENAAGKALGLSVLSGVIGLLSLLGGIGLCALVLGKDGLTNLFQLTAETPGQTGNNVPGPPQGVVSGQAMALQQLLASLEACRGRINQARNVNDLRTLYAEVRGLLKSQQDLLSVGLQNEMDEESGGLGKTQPSFDKRYPRVQKLMAKIDNEVRLALVGLQEFDTTPSPPPFQQVGVLGDQALQLRQTLEARDQTIIELNDKIAALQKSPATPGQPPFQPDTVLFQKVSGLEQRIAEKNIELSSLRDQLRQVEGELEATQRERNSATARISQLETQLAEMRKDIAEMGSLKTQFEQEQSKAISLQTQLTAAQREAVQAKSDAEAAAGLLQEAEAARTRAVQLAGQIRTEANQQAQTAIAAAKEQTDKDIAAAQQQVKEATERGALYTEESKALEYLRNRLPAFSSRLRECAEQLVESAAAILPGGTIAVAADAGNESALKARKTLQLIERVFADSPSVARLTGTAPASPDSLTAVQAIAVLQKSLCERLLALKIAPIDPARGDAYLPHLFSTSDEQNEWIDQLDKDNQVHSVLKIGFTYRERPLRTAFVRRYVYLKTGSGSAATVRPPSAVDPDERDTDNVQAVTPSQPVTSPPPPPVTFPVIEQPVQQAPEPPVSLPVPTTIVEPTESQTVIPVAAMPAETVSSEPSLSPIEDRLMDTVASTSPPPSESASVEAPTLESKADPVKPFVPPTSEAHQTADAKQTDNTTGEIHDQRPEALLSDFFGKG